MSKTRLTSLDISFAVRDLKAKLLPSKLKDIYDFGTRTYLFVFLRSSGQKVYMVLESGIRVHTTQFLKEHSRHVSIFTQTLRNNLRSKRLVAITQLGFDRVVDFEFTAGNNTLHLICEFYAAGNVVLTDAKYEIILPLRSYESEDESITISAKRSYPMTPQQVLMLPTESQLLQLIETFNPKKSIKEAFSSIFVIGKEMIEHCLLTADTQMDPKMKIQKFPKDLIPIVFKSFEKAYNGILNLPQDVMHAYLVFSDCSNLNSSSCTNKVASDSDFQHALSKSHRLYNGKIYESDDRNVVGLDIEEYCEKKNLIPRGYSPLPYVQYDPNLLVKTQDFDSALDMYYYYIECDRIKTQCSQAEKSSIMRLNKVKSDNEQRVDALSDHESQNEKCSLAILSNLSAVNGIIQEINRYIQDKMKWDVIQDKVEALKKDNNSYFSLVQELDVAKRNVTLLLQYEDLVLDQCSEGAPAPVLVKIDLNLNAHENCNKYFEFKKKVAEKKQKTIKAADLAYKNAKICVHNDQKDEMVKSNVRKLRKIFWFEKFNWFISSNGYIVISGRDMQQNDLIYKKYMRAGDIYVHADIHGAASCVIKNMSGGSIPEKTLLEAGAMSVCHSTCWKNKVVTSSWWVYESQVSKTAPSGQYLTTGSFMIRGKKNYLPPSMLVMGFGLIFKVHDDDSMDLDDVVNVEQNSNLLHDNQNSNLLDNNQNLLDHTIAPEPADQTVLCAEEIKTVETPEYNKSFKDLIDAPSSVQESSYSIVKDSKLKERPKLNLHQKNNFVSSTSTDNFGTDCKAKLNGSGGILQNQLHKGSRSQKKLEQEKLALEEYKSKMNYINKKKSEQLIRDKQEEEIRIAAKEENLKLVTQENSENIKPDTSKSLGVNLDAFECNPSSESVLIHAMCVCAPYTVLENYKFKLKLVPGMMKKGRSTKFAIEHFLKNCNATNREKEVIKSIPEPEAILAMISDVSLQASGLNSIFEQKKKKQR